VPALAPGMGHAHRRHQVAAAPGRDALDVGFLEHRGERLRGGPAGLAKAREAGALPELGEPRFGGSGPGLPDPDAVAVARVDRRRRPLAMAGKSYPIIGHHGSPRFRSVSRAQPWSGSRDGRPLWITGLPTPDPCGRFGKPVTHSADATRWDVTETGFGEVTLRPRRRPRARHRPAPVPGHRARGTDRRHRRVTTRTGFGPNRRRGGEVGGHGGRAPPTESRRRPPRRRYTTLLAPGIVEAILDGRQPADLLMAAPRKPLPVAWAARRHSLGLSHAADPGIGGDSPKGARPLDGRST